MLTAPLAVEVQPVGKIGFLCADTCLTLPNTVLPGDRERCLLTTALVGATLAPEAPEGHMLRGWLDTWSGAVQVLEAITELGYTARLNQSDFRLVGGVLPGSGEPAAAMDRQGLRRSTLAGGAARGARDAAA